MTEYSLRALEQLTDGPAADATRLAADAQKAIDASRDCCTRPEDIVMALKAAWTQAVGKMSGSESPDDRAYTRALDALLDAYFDVSNSQGQPPA